MSQIPDDERGHDGLTSAERIEQMTRPIQEWWPAMRSTREAELEAQVEALQREMKTALTMLQEIPEDDLSNCGLMAVADVCQLLRRATRPAPQEGK